MSTEAASLSAVEAESISSSSGNNAAADFECNICLDLAQDPVITLCGHLYCWPCLYRWLRLHSQSQECPVCKALILEEKLIPLYGRGKTPNDPRTRAIPEFEIPNRPTGQLPETATHATGPINFSNYSVGFLGGFFSFATASFGKSGGVPHPGPPMQFHGFPNSAADGTRAANISGYSDALNGNPSHVLRRTAQGQADHIISKVLLFVGFMVLYTVFPDPYISQDDFLLLKKKYRMSWCVCLSCKYYLNNLP